MLFDRQAAVQIAPGQTVWSDAVELPSAARADLAISMYLQQPTPRASWHLIGSRTSYRSKAGNHVSDAEFPTAYYDRSIYFLAGVAVEASPDVGVWVAFGDSITDGNGHSVDQDASWPARVTTRWRDSAASPAVGMLNAGVSGGRSICPGLSPGSRPMPPWRSQIPPQSGRPSFVRLMKDEAPAGAGPGASAATASLVRAKPSVQTIPIVNSLTLITTTPCIIS